MREFAIPTNKSEKAIGLTPTMPHKSRIVPRSTERNDLITWQEISHLQYETAAQLRIGSRAQECILARLQAHYAELGIRPYCDVKFSLQDRYSYDELRAYNLPQALEDWLVSSELYFSARASDVQGIILPYEWLNSELSIIDYWQRSKSGQRVQETVHREEPIWLNDWSTSWIVE